MWQACANHRSEGERMARRENGRLLIERSIDGKSRGEPKHKRPARSVTVNIAESPLGWLFSRGLISTVQFDAGERLRGDWERALLAPHVTMAWDSAPITRSRGGSSPALDPSSSQVDAKRRFEAALSEAG